MESGLRGVLAGFDASVVAKLASNDIHSLQDASLLTAQDLKELGFTLGVRNRLLKVISDAQPSSIGAIVRGIGGSMKDLFVSVGGTTRADSPPADLAHFKGIFNDLGKEDAAGKEKRDKLYPCWDTNDNGYLSLAEVDKGIRITLIGELKDAKLGERIWKKYRKCYIRAFIDAADAAPQRQRARTTLTNGRRRPVSDDDYVTRREFRLLICYLSIYATMYEVFTLVDGKTEGITVDDDSRISKKEWVAGIEHVNRAGNSWAPFERLRTADKASFEEIDANHGGFILLTELCEWIEQGEKIVGSPAGKLLGIGE